ncbi:hypothetical protein TanjilG_10935 [Lupinus angustifolius]|uniref:Retroviral polymerase SH3-like domain-containing protein n=1 Tax=Lupinus angustifolius TaxID=3871 RepID=A0A1J7G4X9_LUPAN|nr:hypothetical protein TanjilG_10935 [Lupinus angustifolius]
MLNESKVPKYFWADAVHKTCYVMNRVLLRPNLLKNPYELLKGPKPTISHLHALGYSLHSKAFRVFNKYTMHVEESIHVHFDESSPNEKRNVLSNDVAGALEEAYTKDLEKDKDAQEDHEVSEDHYDLLRVWKTKKDHPLDKVIDDISMGVVTRNSLRNFCNFVAFVSQIEPKIVDEAIEDEFWGIAMQEELNQFERNNVWDVVPKSKDHLIIGSKWVFRNKLDEYGLII